MASALLAVAFVVTTSRNRGVAEKPTPISRDVADAGALATAHRLAGWRQSLAQFVDRQLLRFFHCALPSGLDPHDFDLSDLTKS